MGHTSMVPDSDDQHYTKNGLLAFMDVALGGRAAEEVFLGKDNVSIGCSSDLEKTTYFGYKYIRDFVLDDDNFFLAADKEKLSDESNYKIDLRVNELIKESYERVKKLMRDNEKDVKLVVENLLEKETLSVDEVEEIVGTK